MILTPPAPDTVRNGFEPDVLRAIHAPETGVCIWHRRTSIATLMVLDEVLAGAPPFQVNVPVHDVCEINAALLQVPRLRRNLGDPLIGNWLKDLLALTDAVFALFDAPLLRLRLDWRDGDKPEAWEIAPARVRLMAMFIGAGLQWKEGETEDGARPTSHEVEPWHVALFKGERYPGRIAPAIAHRFTHQPHGTSHQLRFTLDA